MALTREAYRAIEDIVGPEYISEEPAVLESYACPGTPKAIFTFGDPLAFRPEAVVTPGGTEEVQAIVRLCNRFRLILKPSSYAGWGPWALSSGPDVLQMDLGRMNRILEIDEKNMIAVIEPNVRFGQLQVEANKRGLCTHVIGAGPGASALADATSAWGHGPNGIYTGFMSRNLLGVEWVLPTGEIARLGALGTGAGWFCGDGPGPSLRGIIRGYVGALGGFGVFTKAAIKLYPWPPGAPKIIGRTPVYEMEFPELVRVYPISFPSYYHRGEAQYLITEAKIAYALWRQPPYFILATMTGSNQEMWEEWQKGWIQVKLANPLTVIVVANTRGELEYADACLREIMKKTEGSIDPEIQENKKLLSALFFFGHYGGETVKLCYRATGDFVSLWCNMESIDAIVRSALESAEHERPYVERGIFFDEGSHAWGVDYEQGSLTSHAELACPYDPYNPESVRGTIDYTFDAAMEGTKRGHLLPYYDTSGGPFHETAGPYAFNYHLWMRKIKVALDPNIVGDPSWYIGPVPVTF